MSDDARAFEGFAGISRSTVIPNVFFSEVLPRMRGTDDLLAFLWLARSVQDQRGEARFATADQVWAQDGAPAAFDTLGSGFDGLVAGLDACVELGAALAMHLRGAAGEQLVYLVNNPGSRRTVGRARSGEVRLLPETVAVPVFIESRPTIFRLYEENVGTITPLVGERLVTASETYSAEWIHEAFKLAVEMNVRNWRYIERILQRWAEEGRNEGTEDDSLEDRKRRFLGGDLGHIVRYR